MEIDSRGKRKFSITTFIEALFCHLTINSFTHPQKAQPPIIHRNSSPSVVSKRVVSQVISALQSFIECLNGHFSFNFFLNDYQKPEPPILHI